MPRKKWTLVDLEQDVHLDHLEITPNDVGGALAGFAISKRCLRGGLRDGVDVIEVDNGAIRFVILPTRGMGLWRLGTGNVELAWKSPILGPVNPRFVPLGQPDGLGFLFGFDEFLCRCGLESHGAPQFDPQGTLVHPLHGRIANSPAHRVEVEVDGETGEIRFTGVVDETRFLGSKLRLRSTFTTRIGSHVLSIRDEVTNLSASVADYELLYHTNFGPPLLEPGARLVAPFKAIAPRDAEAAKGIDAWDQFPAPQPGFEEQVYFIEPQASETGHTEILLRNAPGDFGASVRFDTNQSPCFTLWKNAAAEADGYVIGLEPGTSLPNVKSFEAAQGRVPKLAGGGSALHELEIEICIDGAEVAAAEARIAGLQQATEPQIHRHPRPDWSPQ